MMNTFVGWRIATPALFLARNNSLIDVPPTAFSLVRPKGEELGGPLANRLAKPAAEFVK